MISTKAPKYLSNIFQTPEWMKVKEKLVESPSGTYPAETSSIWLIDGESILPLNRCVWHSDIFGSVTSRTVAYEAMSSGEYGGPINGWTPKLKTDFLNLLENPDTLWIRLIDFYNQSSWLKDHLDPKEFVAHLIPLDKYDPSRNVQRQIKRAELAGVKIAQVTATDYYDLAKAHRGRLVGARPNLPPKAFYRAIDKQMAFYRLAETFFAFCDNKPVAGMIVLKDVPNNTIFLYANISDSDYWKSGANAYLHDYIFRWAIDLGFKTANFGASPPQSKGVSQFKEMWHGVEHHYYGYGGKFNQ